MDESNNGLLDRLPTPRTRRRDGTEDQQRTAGAGIGVAALRGTGRRSRLEGMDRQALQHNLYAACVRFDPAPQATEHRLALGRALIHLRRTGAERYFPDAHLPPAAAQTQTQTQSQAQSRGLSAGLSDRVRRTALPLGARVFILGERYGGSIVHRVIVREPNDPYPAPWYVVLCEPLATCRAHGADELEPVDRRMLPTHLEYGKRPPRTPGSKK